jgi:hypothetical protein
LGIATSFFGESWVLISLFSFPLFNKAKKQLGFGHSRGTPLKNNLRVDSGINGAVRRI